MNLTNYRNPYTGDAPPRTNVMCPRCKQKTAVFFCASNEPGRSWFHCVRVLATNACGHYFTTTSPKPLRREEPCH